MLPGGAMLVFGPGFAREGAEPLNFGVMKTTKTTKTTKSAPGAQRGTMSAGKTNKTVMKAQTPCEPVKKHTTTRASMVASTRKK